MEKSVKPPLFISPSEREKHLSWNMEESAKQKSERKCSYRKQKPPDVQILTNFWNFKMDKIYWKYLETMLLRGINSCRFHCWKLTRSSSWRFRKCCSQDLKEEERRTTSKWTHDFVCYKILYSGFLQNLYLTNIKSTFHIFNFSVPSDLSESLNVGRKPQQKNKTTKWNSYLEAHSHKRKIFEPKIIECFLFLQVSIISTGAQYDNGRLQFKDLQSVYFLWERTFGWIQNQEGKKMKVNAEIQIFKDAENKWS